VLLDLQLHHLPAHFVHLGGHRVDLHAQPRGRLVDQVDRLVGQEAVGDVAVRERRGRHDGRVLDAHAVVHLVALLQAAQDRDGVLDARLAHHDGSKTPLERGIFFDVLAIFGDGGGADAVQLAAGQRRLQHVARVHRALGRARADDGVQLVDEHDHLAIGRGDLFEDSLEALLELAAKLGACDQGRHVERDQALVLQSLGHVAVDDAPREPLDDGGLAHARIADEHRIVLRAPREHLNDAPDLLVAPDDRIELSLAGAIGQVVRIFFQRAELRLRVRRRHLVARAQRRQSLQNPLARRAHALERARGAAVLLGRERQY